MIQRTCCTVWWALLVDCFYFKKELLIDAHTIPTLFIVDSVLSGIVSVRRCRTLSILNYYSSTFSGATCY